MRYAKRVDENQDAIVKALREAGAYVWIISLPVDLLVGYKNHTFLVEVKSNDRKRLTPLQEDFFKDWIGGTLCRIDSPEAALRMIGTLNET
jgi:phosphoserine phosphatase